MRALRDEINTIDQRLLELFNQRAGLAQRAGTAKEETGKEQKDRVNFHHPQREAQVLARICSRNSGPLSDAQVTHLFRELMSCCLLMQQRMTVAYLGPAGTFTHGAALKHFGSAAATVDLGSIDQVFRKVAAGICNYGVVPVENSTEGVVNHTLDMLVVSRLLICGEVQLPVHHHLLRRPGDQQPLRQIYAHSQTFAQCRSWLDENLPHSKRVHVNSNGEAARRIGNESGCAAIAGSAAADIHALEVQEQNIEDDPNNTTRFLIIGSQSVPASGQDKTTVLFAAPNRAGALCELLNCFTRNEVNMTRIESRPSRQGLWDYIFFVDLEGHIDEPRIDKALEDLKAEAGLCKWLGSYPTALP